MLAIQEFLARYGISEFGKYGYEIILVSILLFATIVMVLERRCLNIFKARCVSVPKTGYLDVDGEDDDTEYHANNITEDPDISTHLNSIGQISYIWDRLSDDDMIKRSKEFYRLMDKRRTIRYFSSEPVPKEAIEAILRTAGKILISRLLRSFLITKELGQPL